jgi:hypothetical protein
MILDDQRGTSEAGLERRDFLAGSLGVSALAMAGRGAEAQVAATGREYYELRQYHMQSGPQGKALNNYLNDALIPGLNRLGMSPVGAFNLEIGPETPTAYVLIAGASVEALVTADLKLADDPVFMKAAEPFWSAATAQPAFTRIDSTLMVAFEGRPKLKVPPVTATKGKRLFQLRIYESATNADHVRKVEMFHKGEFDYFEKAGFWPVFYADAVIGPRLPKLVYLLSFPGLPEMTAYWAAFQSDPGWKKLSSDPRYASQPIVSSVTNLVLNPMGCSQI